MIKNEQIRQHALRLNVDDFTARIQLHLTTQRGPGQPANHSIIEAKEHFHDRDDRCERALALFGSLAAVQAIQIIHRGGLGVLGLIELPYLLIPVKAELGGVLSALQNRWSQKYQ